MIGPGTTDYTNKAQQRILDTLLVMFGHEIDGLSSGQVAKLAGTTASAATRDLFNLTRAGMVERTTNGDRYRLTPLLGQKALAILTNIERAGKRVEEARQRYTRIP
uniref:IclR helix-turn-helix domain-containing protein n=1 Tax=Candidatus Kentrum sp. LFY TaxID=2126342 RepID=A0A450WGX1_9GAMM|nr:MAG: hypothetical protein BECKLFY1418C_GA0070996_10228 [Candidatus Kentron sp. LFY]